MEAEEGDVLPSLEVAVVAYQNAALRGREGVVRLVRPQEPPPGFDPNVAALRTISSDPFSVDPVASRQPVDVGVLFDFPSLQRGDIGRDVDALASYFSSLAASVGTAPTFEAMQQLARDLLGQMLAPEFGSAPKAWQTLSELVASATSTGAVYVEHGDPVFAVLTGVATTVVIRIALPIADALGKGAASIATEVSRTTADVLAESVETRLRRNLGLPPAKDSDAGGDADPEQSNEPS